MSAIEIFLILYLAAIILEMIHGVQRVDERKAELLPFVKTFGPAKLAMFVTFVLFVFSLFWPYFVWQRLTAKKRG
jgi:hypothetical protein